MPKLFHQWFYTQSKFDWIEDMHQIDLLAKVLVKWMFLVNMSDKKKEIYKKVILTRLFPAAEVEECDVFTSSISLIGSDPSYHSESLLMWS